MKYGLKLNKPVVAKTVALALVAVLFGSLVQTGRADTFYQLTVNVNDTCGPVVAQATIVNGPDDGAFGITNSSGQFVFTALHAGVFYVHISADNHTSQDTAAIVLTSDQSITVTLGRTGAGCGTPPPGGGATHQLTVNVNDTCGPVVAQVVVVNGPDDGAFGITNASGQFVFTSLSDGVFYLHITSDNHTSQDTAAIVLNSDQSITVTLGRTNGGCTTNPVNVPMVFHVHANCIGENIPGALVSAGGTSGSTDSSGNVTLSVAPNSNIAWTASASGYNSASGTNNSDSGSTIVDITLTRNCGGTTCTTGTIVVTSNLPSPAYYLTEPDGTRVGWNGSHTFNNMPLGNYSIQADDAAGYTKSLSGTSGTLTGCGTLSVTITYTPVAVNPCTTGTITVTSNLANASYTISRPNGTTFSAIGSNSFSSQILGAYSIQANDISGYTKTVSPASGNLVGCGTLNFSINYQANQNQPPTGSLDQADCNLIAGWTQDPDTLNTAVTVEIYRDGGFGIGILAATTQANQFRSDIGQHAYQIATPVGFKDGSSHTVYVYALDSTTGLRTLLPGSPKTISCVVVQLPGTVSVTKNVRDVTTGQSVFSNSIAVNPNDLVEFQIQVTANNGGVSNVVLTDTMPSQLIYVPNSFTIDGVPSGNNLNAVGLGNLNINQTRTVVVRATVADSSQFTNGITTTLTNLASITSASNSVNAQANVNVTVNQNNNGNLTLVKTARDITLGGGFSKNISANPGDQVQFQIQVTANGNIAAQNVNVIDTLPNNFNLTSGSTTFNLGTMAAGSTQTVTLTASLNSSSSFPQGTSTWTNNAQATSTNAGTASDTAVVYVANNTNCSFSNSCNSNASLTLLKEVRDVTTGTNFSGYTNASNNDQVQFRLTVTNTSYNNYSNNNYATNVRLTDSLPYGLTYVPGTFQVNTGTAYGSLFSGSEYLGNIFSGQSVVITFQASVNNAFGSQTLVNTATASADNANSASASASVYVSSVLGGNIDLVLSKRAFNQTQNVDATSVNANSGDIIIYTLSVRNQGNASATNFVFQDNLSDVLQLSQLQTFGDAAFDLANLSLTWPATTIPSGSTIEKTFSVKVNSTFPAGSDNLMTNVFGNTINVPVNKPVVLGAFLAPKTGSSTTVVFILALICTLGYMAFVGYKRSQVKLNV